MLKYNEFANSTFGKKQRDKKQLTSRKKINEEEVKTGNENSNK